MRLIAAILVVAFSGAAVGQDFGGHALFVRTADTNRNGKKNTKGGLCESILSTKPAEEREREREREREKDCTVVTVMNKYVL